MSLPAGASGWVEVQGLNGVRKYVELDRLERHGPVITTHELMSYQWSIRFAGEWVSSIRWVNQYQCETRAMRVLSYTAYAQPMGKGPITFAGEQQADWTDAPPGSLAAGVMDRVCER